MHKLDLLTIETANDFENFICLLYEVEESIISKLWGSRGAKVIEISISGITNKVLKPLFTPFSWLIAYLQQPKSLAAGMLLGPGINAA